MAHDLRERYVLVDIARLNPERMSQFWYCYDTPSGLVKHHINIYNNGTPSELGLGLVNGDGWLTIKADDLYRTKLYSIPKGWKDYSLVTIWFHNPEGMS